MSTVPPSLNESESLIRNCLGECEQYLSEIENLCGLLEQRLDVVLSPVPPTPAGADAATKAGQMPHSHFWHRAALHREALKSIAARLSFLRSRVEV